VDDIQLVCGDNAEEGVCMCEQGYHEESKVHANLRVATSAPLPPHGSMTASP